MYEILTLSLNGMKKTHVMYKANLSHNQLEKFLEILIEKNLLTVENNQYITTEKGREFIKEFRELLIILGESNAHRQYSIN
jgi:predicted transcriptional regulator